MVVILLLLAALGMATSAAAQDTPIPTTPTHVICDSGCGSPPASADGTTFTAGVTNVSLIGAAFNDALAAASSGTYAAPRITAFRALHINLRDSAGAEFGTFANPLRTLDQSGVIPLSDSDLRASPVAVTVTNTGTPIEVGGLAGASVPVVIADSSGATIGKVNLAEVTSGTNATIKVASTLPALTDTAVVTTQRDPLPAGTNVIGHVVCDSGCAAGAPGQQLMAASSPVVIASNQSAVPVSGTLTAVTAITNALPAGTNVIGHVIVDSSGVIHVVIDSSATLTVTGPLTDTQLRATAVPISGTTTVTQGTGTNLHMVADSGTITTVAAVTGITNALPAGSNVIGHVVADSGSTTAVTGNVAVTNAGLTNLDVALSTRTKPADQQHTILDSGTITTLPAITGTVTANAGSNLNTSALALESGGNLATEVANSTTIASAVGTTGSTVPTKTEMVGGMDGAGKAQILATTTQGVLYVQQVGQLPVALTPSLFPACNAVRKLNCR